MSPGTHLATWGHFTERGSLGFCLQSAAALHVPLTGYSARLIGERVPGSGACPVVDARQPAGCHLSGLGSFWPGLRRPPPSTSHGRGRGLPVLVPIAGGASGGTHHRRERVNVYSVQLGYFSGRWSGNMSLIFQIRLLAGYLRKVSCASQARIRAVGFPSSNNGTFFLSGLEAPQAKPGPGGTAAAGVCPSLWAAPPQEVTLSLCPKGTQPLARSCVSNNRVEH